MSEPVLLAALPYALRSMGRSAKRTQPRQPNADTMQNHLHQSVFDRVYRYAVRVLGKSGKSSRSYLRGNRPVSLNELICPLRYDILIREYFFEFLRAHDDIYRSEFREFLRLARNTPYFNWFRDIVCVRFKPELLSNEADLNEAFAERVMKTAQLLASFERRGLDSGQPITLRAGEKVLPTSSGKGIYRGLYAGDGCHRLALMRLRGYDKLNPEFYRISLEPEYRPLDNTTILIRSLSMREPEYARFLSMGYAEREFSDLVSLRNHVQRAHPKSMKEFDQVLESDESRLTR